MANGRTEPSAKAGGRESRNRNESGVQSAYVRQKLAFEVDLLGFEIDLRRARTIHYLLLYLKLDFRNIYI
jgi:hypothetical protein